MVALKIRDLYVWVTRVNDTAGDVSFGDLSDGERQLLMVPGLISGVKRYTLSLRYRFGSESDS